MSPRQPVRLPLFQQREEEPSSERPTILKPKSDSFSSYSRERPIADLEKASAGMREYAQNYAKDLCLPATIGTLLQEDFPWFSARDETETAHSRREIALHQLLGEQLFNMQRLLTDPSVSRKECQDAVRICALLGDNVYARNLVVKYKEQLEGVLRTQTQAA